MPRIPPGQRNGRLEILEYLGNPSDPKHPKYRCRCDCGTVVDVQTDNLRRTHSCGCLKREMLQAKATHGLSNSPEFRIWAGLIDRCSRVTRADFSRYGGRGITVCARWLAAFEHFYADMGPRPTPKHTIDRIDNNRGYEPGNCRWATMKTQRINQRRFVLHTYKGMTGTVTDIAAHFGATRYTVYDRLWRLHESIEDAMAAGLRTTQRIHGKSK